MKTKQFDEPTGDDLHVDTTGGGKAKAKKGRNGHFMAKMVSLMSAKCSPEEMAEMVKSARSHAGGMTKAEIAKMKAAIGDSYDGPDAEPDNDPDDKPANKMTRKYDEPESLTDKLREIEVAFSLKYGNGGDYNKPADFWCMEIWDTYVIARGQKDGELYKFPYSYDNDKVVFSSPNQVYIQYVDYKASEGDVADLCAKGHGWRLFIEHAFAEPPEWMPLLPKPGNYQHPEYGEIKITKKRNAGFVKNFEAGVYQSKLPINTEHAPDNDGAYGWIEGLRLNENGSVDARVKWSDRGTEAIRNDRFRYISAEWADSWTDAEGKTFQDVLRGAALTVRPYFKDKFLRPLVASEKGLFVAEQTAENAKPGAVVFFSALPSAPVAQPDTKPEGVKQMAENITTAEPTVDAKAFAELTDKVKMLSELTEKQNDTIKNLSEANTKLATDARAKRFTDEVKGRVEGGVKWHGDHEKHLAFLEKMAGAFGESSDEVKGYIEQQRTIAKQIAESNLFTEIGADGTGADTGDATAKLDTLVKKEMGESKLGYADAMAKVIAANPQLYAEHSNARTVRV